MFDEILTNYTKWITRTVKEFLKFRCIKSKINKEQLYLRMAIFWEGSDSTFQILSLPTETLTEVNHLNY